MHFAPPLIKNIKDVLPHIQDNPAFIVADKGWYKVIDYVYAHRDTFDNDYARECRGLKFRADTGDIIARPYHKFHNLGECAGYHTTDIDLRGNHVVLDKLDGSMVHTCLQCHEDAEITSSLYLMTRMGLSDQAKAAMEFARNSSVGVGILQLALNNPTKTFIFEYVGPNNRIVIPYPEEMLIMTGVRDIYSGEYLPYGLMAHLARDYDIPVVQAYAGNIALADLNFITNNDELKEGAVVRFATGGMVKMKSEIYVRKHKSKELAESFKGVVQCVIDGTLDDILPAVEEETQADLQEYQKALLDRIAEFHEGLRHILSTRKDMAQKEFALDIQANFPRVTQSLLFSTRKSGDGHAEIIKLIKHRYNSTTDLEALFEAMDFPVWEF